MREATSSDVDMHTLNEMATDSILDSNIEMPETICAFHQYRGNITSADRVILYKNRVIVPPTLHGQVLSTLHAADQGLSMMTAHAESSVPTSGTVPLYKKNANTATGWHPHSWSTAHPTDPGHLSLPGCFLVLFRTRVYITS